MVNTAAQTLAPQYTQRPRADAVLAQPIGSDAAQDHLGRIAPRPRGRAVVEELGVHGLGLVDNDPSLLQASIDVEGGAVAHVLRKLSAERALGLVVDQLL